MDGEVEILVPNEETTILLPDRNKYNQIMSGILSNKKSKTSEDKDSKPSEFEYNIALLAHTIKIFDRIVWQVYDNPEIKTQLQNYIETHQ